MLAIPSNPYLGIGDLPFFCLCPTFWWGVGLFKNWGTLSFFEASCLLDFWDELIWFIFMHDSCDLRVYREARPQAEESFEYFWFILGVESVA